MDTSIHTTFMERNHDVYQQSVYLPENAQMASSYDRLLSAAKKLKGWLTPSEVATGLTRAGYEVTPQKLTNWKSRGMSMEGMVKSAPIIGCRSDWLQTGDGPMQDSAISPVSQPDVNLVDIPQFDQGARMGNGGLVLQDQPGMIRRWEVSRDWLNQNVKGVTAGSQLCIVTGFGDSMKPMFNPGDPLLVDLSVRSVEYDAVYFFRVGDEGFIKRIQRIPGQGLKAISANRDHYEPWTISEDMDFEVLGRVLKVWKGDDF